MIFQESETVELKAIVAADIKKKSLLGYICLPEHKAGKYILPFGTDRSLWNGTHINHECI